MIQNIEMTIHMVPVAKGRPKLSKQGGFARAYTPKKTIMAENNIMAQAVQYRPSTPLQISAHVDMTFFMPIPKGMRKRDMAEAVSETMSHTKKPDLDNLQKLILDALNEIFWRDDSIICSISARKFYSLNTRVKVIIKGE